MPGVTTSAARTAIQAANAAGKQVVVTFSDGSQRSGTARWTLPGYADCRTFYLFGVTIAQGPYTALASTNTVVTAPAPGAGQATYTDISGRNPSSPAFKASALVNIADITAIGTTPANSPALLPATTGYPGGQPTVAESNNADATVGTYVNEYGYRVPDPSWQFGTGLE